MTKGIFMIIYCVWEHNGNDTLLYAIDYIGAYTRGESLEIAKAKMPGEIISYLKISPADPFMVGLMICMSFPNIHSALNVLTRLFYLMNIQNLFRSHTKKQEKKLQWDSNKTALYELNCILSKQHDK